MRTDELIRLLKSIIRFHIDFVLPSMSESGRISAYGRCFISAWRFSSLFGPCLTRSAILQWWKYSEVNFSRSNNSPCEHQFGALGVRLWREAIRRFPLKISSLFYKSGIFKTRVKIGGVDSFEKFPETGILYIIVFRNFTFWCREGNSSPVGNGE